jgi:threonine dehydratase
MGFILVLDCMQVVVEPSGAVGLAAVLSNQFTLARGMDESGIGSNGQSCTGVQKVGIILSGGNVDLAASGLWDRFLTVAQ